MIFSVKKIFLILFVVASLTASMPVASNKSAIDKDITFGYFLYKTYSLDKQTAGYEGKIELWIDKNYESYKNPGVIYDPQNPPPKKIKEFEPRNALLRVVSTNGKETDRLLLEKPHASLNEEMLYGNNKPTYILEQDYTSDFGTYSGPASQFVEVMNGRIQFLMIRDAKKSALKKLSLGNSLKNQWKIVPSKYSKGKDIIFAQYHPDFGKKIKAGESLPFVTDCIRFYFNGHKWVSKKRTIQGGSDFEEDSAFPPIEVFP